MAQEPGGLITACNQSGNDNPCAKAGIITEQAVEDGETKTYEDDNFTAQGTVTVEDGGTVVVENASITFTSTSAGFIVESGGTLVINASTLKESAEGSNYGIDAQSRSNLTIEDSSVLGGSGVKLATDSAIVTQSAFESIPLALHLLHVSVDIHHNAFRNNTVAVNETGGAPTLRSNVFEGGQTCVRNWRTNPNITGNTFRGCHVGIFHEQSHSDITDNDMEDEIEPPGAGIWVKDTLSPNILNNRIGRYGVGILVEDGRAFIRDNTLFENVAAGARIVRNSGPMDVTNNHIFGNGGDGIVLEDTKDVRIAGNDVHDNGGTGAHLVDAAGAQLVGNSFANHVVQVNLTGGDPFVEANHFTGGAFCMRNWQTNPNITGNTFRGCHVGIFHEQSHSEITDNDMEDEIEPPGAGIWVQDTLSPLIQNNRIARYGVGVLIQDARGFVRNNTVSENVATGVHVIRNSAPMDITGNHIFGNGGEGIVLEDTENVTVADNDVHDNGGTGGHAVHTSGTRFAGNTFRNHSVQLNLTGLGEVGPIAENNLFSGGQFCIRNWRTNPSIIGNTFRGCHVGIYHHESHSDIIDNDMEDEIEPPGAGIWVEDTESPLIEGNRIARYGVGVLVTDARAWIRNNTVSENVAAGVHVIRNSAPMDITGNHIFGNGGQGIVLEDTENVTVSGNDVHDNGGTGAFASQTSGTTFTNNDFSNHTVQLNLTGVGDVGPVAKDNSFSGGQFCIRNWQTNPHIANNTFRGCHIGILHEQSHSEIIDNDMEDEIEPPGAGIYVLDTESPLIQGNRIAKYGVGVLIQDARGFVRNNSISENVAAGVHVVRNSAPMDITGNEIFENGGEGILLEDTQDIEVSFNDVRDNAADGILLYKASANSIQNNTLVDNARDGIHLTSFSTANLVSANIVMWTIPKNLGSNRDGVHIEQSSNDNKILANSLTNNRFGVSLAASAGNEIGNNTISGNSQSGVLVSSASGRNFIRGNSLEDHFWRGIAVWHSPNQLVAANTAERNRYGTEFHNSAGAVIQGNRFANNSAAGVQLSQSVAATMRGNTFENDGLNLAGGLLAQFQHDVDDSNTVNGAPIRFVVDEAGVSVASPAGQVFLVNATNATVHGLSLSDAIVGIQVAFSEGVSIVNNSIQRTDRGIHFARQVTGSLVEANLFTDNVVGFWSDSQTMGNDVQANTFLRSESNGILLQNSHDYLLRENTVQTSGANGIHLVQSGQNTIEKNVISDSGKEGLIVRGFNEQNLLRDNTVRANAGAGIQVEDATGAMIMANDLRDNGGGFLNGEGIAVLRSSGMIAANTIEGSHSHGLRVALFDGSVVNNTIDGNGLDGIRATGNRGTLVSINNNLIRNHASGSAAFVADPHDLSFEGNELVGNSRGLWIQGGNDLVVAANVAQGNGDAFIVEPFGTNKGPLNARFTGNTAGNSTGVGFTVETWGKAEFDHNVARDGGGSGYVLNSFGFDDHIRLDHDQAINNHHGFRLNSGPTVAVDLVAVGNRDSGVSLQGHTTRLERVSATDNGGPGIGANCARGVSIVDSIADRNGRSGLDIGCASTAGFPRDYLIQDSQFNENAGGIRVDSATNVTFARVNASVNGNYGLLVTPDKPGEDAPSEVFLDHVRALNNGNYGLWNVRGASTVVSADAWWEGNGLAGVQNDNETVAVDVRNSYWGSPNGPTHPDNPGGDGDAAVGNVLFDPFLTAPPGGA